MMEEGDEALDFEREICWLSEQAEIWLASVDATITEPVHVDRQTRKPASSRPIGRRRSRQISGPSSPS